MFHRWRHEECDAHSTPDCLKIVHYAVHADSGARVMLDWSSVSTLPIGAFDLFVALGFPRRAPGACGPLDASRWRNPPSPIPPDAHHERSPCAAVHPARGRGR